MGARRFALIFGIIYLAVGIAGFVPPLLHAPMADAPQLAVDSLNGRLLGLFPVNIVHTLVHLAIGVWGLSVAKSIKGSVNYARSLAVIYGVLAVMGLIPALHTMFGLAPLHGHDVWLHAGTALIAAYFGFVTRYDTATQRA
jgi:hypothetical protein